MVQALKLKIKSLDPLKLGAPIELDIGKTILYGPNGSGKSAIIRALAYLLTEDVKLLYESDYMNSLAQLFGQADVQLCENSKCVSLRSDGANFSLSGAKLGRGAGAARIVGDYMYTTDARYKYMNPVQNVDDLRNILSSPVVAEKVELFIHNYTELGIERLYGDYFKELANGRYEWRHIALLPTGIKKAIAIIYALEEHDAVFIEAFEAYLHLDLMRALLDFVNDTYSNRIVVIETHSGLPLRWGIAKGWNVYYVKRDSITSLTRLEDLTDTELFRKELEALSF